MLPQWSSANLLPNDAADFHLERGHIRRIIQKDEVGCGVACVSMMTGQSYTAVRQSMFPTGECARTKTRDLQTALRTFGCDVGERLNWIGKRHYSSLELDAVLKVCPKKDGTWHWVVWDAGAKRILDPLEPPYKRIRAISYLRVTRITR